MSVQPLDLVYTWVDGKDAVWRKKRDAILEQLSGHDIEPTATSEIRFISHDELKFSLRSVDRFAPFFRNIFIVTDSQVPAWLVADHPKIQIISHEQIFPTGAFLPSFNSIAIEACLDRIPGLSENFVYANDDVVFSSPVQPSDFVTSDGRVKVRMSMERWTTPSDPATSLYECLEANTVRALESKLGQFYRGTHVRKGKNFFKNLMALLPSRGVWNRPAHSVQVLNKTAMKEARKLFPEQFEALMQDPFRHRSAISSLGLINYFAIWKGVAVAVGSHDFIFLRKGMSSVEFGQGRDTLLQPSQRGVKIVCVNDGEDESNFDWYAHSIGLLRTMFPTPSSFEQERSSPSTSRALPHPTSTQLAAYAAYRAAS